MKTDGVKANQEGIVSDVARHLASIFRHLLPGVLVLGAARLSYPHWFTSFKGDNTYHAVMLGVVTLAVGNVWFALNRYAVHQILDLAFYLMKMPGPVPRDPKKDDYVNDLALFTRDSLAPDNPYQHIQEHVKFRASTVLLIFTVAELLFLITQWHVKESWMGRLADEERRGFAILSFFVFGIGIWQMVITRRIDYYGANRK